jgi:putative toxin-antitoxin system antitoxin component (TIGR02293 family)
MHLCESCFFQTRGFLKQERRTQNLFNDAEGVLPRDDFGLIAKDDFFGDRKASGWNFHPELLFALISLTFPALTLLNLVATGLISSAQQNQILSLRALKCRVQTGQLLSCAESDRLFRYTHIFSMALAIFGCSDKAVRWLDKPKAHFTGRTPTQMLSTLCGLNQVELMLIQITEGYAL